MKTPTATRFHARMSLETEIGVALSDTRIRLLEEIGRKGSINQAAKAVPLSYKAAWDAIETLNNLAPEQLTNDAQMRDLVAAGWDTIQHLNNMTDEVPPSSRSMNDFPPDAADLRRVFAGWQRWSIGGGWGNAVGRSVVSHLQNSGPAPVANAVDIYREHGIRTSRGSTPDNEYGIDPFLSSSNTPSFYDPIAHG